MYTPTYTHVHTHIHTMYTPTCTHSHIGHTGTHLQLKLLIPLWCECFWLDAGGLQLSHNLVLEVIEVVLLHVLVLPWHNAHYAVRVTLACRVTKEVGENGIHVTFTWTPTPSSYSAHSDTMYKHLLSIVPSHCALYWVIVQEAWQSSIQFISLFHLKKISDTPIAPTLMIDASAHHCLFHT